MAELYQFKIHPYVSNRISQTNYIRNNHITKSLKKIIKIWGYNV
jgi:hypothetical protein